MKGTCGSTETSSGEPCKWNEEDKGPCPWHSEERKDETNTRQTMLEESPEIKEIIIGELQNGATVPEACAEAGVTKRQYYLWRDKAGETDKELFRDFRDETTRARRIAGKNDRRNLRERCMETDDTRTWYKLHHDQYGDTYGKEEEQERSTGGQPFSVPDDLIKKWQQEAQ